MGKVSKHIHQMWLNAQPLLCIRCLYGLCECLHGWILLFLQLCMVLWTISKGIYSLLFTTMLYYHRYAINLWDITVIFSQPPPLRFVFTGYTGHWGHQFGDGSSQCLLCPGTDQHSIQKQAFLTAVLFTAGCCLPTFMRLWKELNKSHWNVNSQKTCFKAETNH